MFILEILVLASILHFCKGQGCTLKPFLRRPDVLSRFPSARTQVTCLKRCLRLRTCWTYMYDDYKNTCSVYDQHSMLLKTTRVDLTSEQRRKMKKMGFKDLRGLKISVQVPNVTLTWTEAAAFCKSMGSQLITMKNRRKKKALLKIVKKLYYDGVWIGASDVYGNNTYYWEDGGKVAFNGWGFGQPSHGHVGYEENCVQIRSLLLYQWNDVPCNETWPFMCEIDLP